MNKNSYVCPVCGFNGLKEPSWNQQGEPSYEVCPCCGFEFGFDAANSQGAFTAFRQHWIESGAKWFMPKLKPKDWDLQTQLENIEKK